MEALKEFPNLFIQSETSASTHEYSERNLARKYVMLLSNFGDELLGLSPVLEAGFRHQLVLVPLTGLFACVAARENVLRIFLFGTTVNLSIPLFGNTQIST